jgi:hypothetical protein
MYENQGAQRFGADNRLFIVLHNKGNFEISWELKINFDRVFQKINEFFNKGKVSKKDKIIFIFANKMYAAVIKVLIIIKYIEIIKANFVLATFENIKRKE